MKEKTLSLFCLFIISSSLSFAADISFTLKNKLQFNRADEMVEIALTDVADFSNLVLYNESGEILPYEEIAPGKIRFQANFKVAEAVTFTLKTGKPVAPSKKTYAAQKSPNSRNDIAWENDLTAYRMYSSKLLSSEPNTANGVDIWYKKKAEPVIDAMYNLSNYHSESEYGVDAHSVGGKTLGGGGIAAYVGDKIWLHNPYDECQIVENGPLRSEFILTYNNVLIDGDSYTKTLRVITTANGLLNKAIVKLKGKNKPMKMAAGIFLHTNTQGVTFTDEENIIGYAENYSEGTVISANARMYAGVYMPGSVTTATVDNHLLIMADYTVGTEFTYYFGGGWNVFPQDRYMVDQDWFDALIRFKQTVESPIAETFITNQPEKTEVLDLVIKVNNYWQSNNANSGNSFWNRAAYHIGNIAAYEITKEVAFLNYSTTWAQNNKWSGVVENNNNKDKTTWTNSYSEDQNGKAVLFGDWQACFQVYIDLYNLDTSKPERIARTTEVMDYQISTDQDNYLWWADALFMVMPVMTRMYKQTENTLYLDKMYEYWQYANSKLYDTDDYLYYARDSYRGKLTVNGKKDFWSRGNGWVFAALANVLKDIPENESHREEYITYYQKMAEKLATLQMEEGYWSRSLADPNYASGYETSGTAFFLYGYLWGINNGFLSEKMYGETVEKAWDYLTNVALHSNGKIGYVQGIGQNAGEHTVTKESTADFGVGAYLLAASEMYRYVAGNNSKVLLRFSSLNTLNENQIMISYNDMLDAATVSDLTNYTIDGEPIDGTAQYDGDRSVIITLNEPLKFNTIYSLYVKSMKSLSEMTSDEINQDFVLTVESTSVDDQITVTAIGNQTGNTPDKTIDNNLDTRWSKQGLEQWILYDLGTEKEVYAVDLAFYSGNQRLNYFDIEVSVNGEDFTPVLIGGVSSGVTNKMERYSFEPQNVRYVKIVCNGNAINDWNSITEARIRYTDSSNIAMVGNQNATFVLYPNPIECNANISVSCQEESNESCQIDILNSLGMVIVSDRVSGFPVSFKSPSQPGAYFMRIINGSNQTNIQKFIVK